MGAGRNRNPAGQFILGHPVAAWLIWILGMFLVNGTFVSVAESSEPYRFHALAWITLAELAALPLVAMLVVRRRQQVTPAEFVVIMWAIAQTPVILSYVAVLEDGPQWLVAAAVAGAVSVMAYALRLARRDRRGGGDDAPA